MPSHQILTAILSLFAGGGVGALGFLLYRRMLDEKVRNAAEKEAERLRSSRAMCPLCSMVRYEMQRRASST